MPLAALYECFETHKFDSGLHLYMKDAAFSVNVLTSVCCQIYSPVVMFNIALDIAIHKTLASLVGCINKDYENRANIITKFILVYFSNIEAA